MKQDSNTNSEIDSSYEETKVGDTQGDPSISPCPGDFEKPTTHSSEAIHDPAPKVTAAQDWDGPDDVDNPLNWSSWKKAYTFFPVAFLAFSVTVGSSVISPATRDLEEYFHVSRTVAILPLTVFVLGLGFGPLIGAPLSEQYGRTIVFKISAPAYIIFLVGSGCSKTFAGLLVCRLLAGLAGAPVLAVGSGTNADLFPAHQRAVTATGFISAPFLGPAIGPIIGGFAAQFRGWQWTMWSTIIVAGAAFLCVLPMPETYKKVILQKRAKKRGLSPPPGSEVRGREYWRTLATTTLIRPTHMLLFEPTVLLFAVYNAFTFCVMFAFFPAIPYTFAKVYGFNTWQSGLAFAGIGVGVLLGGVTTILCDRLIYQKKHREMQKRGVDGATAVRPEERLHAAMMGAVGLPIGLFWFAWTAREDVHWISPILAGIPFAWGNLSLFLAASLYQIDVYGPRNGASAMAANGLLRYVLGGCFPLWTIQMYEGLGIHWAPSLLGFVCVLMLPIPFVFYRFGPAIRARSRYDTTKA